ncbi:tropomyosin-1 [Aspergillus ellipticus CBS 707.79]|uniref:Tropomyosin-1 n=1 Tax=Aspergillus ellipticus CBS 707.79 TaxID=1448320 RepID=A0A319DBC2_9EURO|nr:tropomyosin-1 [Aspergillus ellipticus CBS 707.79]
MDRIREKMKNLQADADAAKAEAEKLEAKLQALQEDNEQKDQEIAALTSRHQELEELVEDTDLKAREAKKQREQDDIQDGHDERRIQALQASCDQWEAKYKDVEAKHAKLQEAMDSLVGEMGDI